MPNKSKARKQRLEAMAKARANNPNNNKNNNSNISLNDALIGTQLETTDHSESDTNLENQFENQEVFDEYDSDATPEIYEEYDSDVTPEIEPNVTPEDSKDPDFTPLPPKTMLVPSSFLAQVMKNVACIECAKPGGMIPSVTKASEFQNEVTFTCRCKHSFSLQTFPDTNINEVLIRNAISNGIPKMPFQRFLQVGNFGANVDGKEVGINLSSRQSMNIYKEQNQVIIDEAEQMHKDEVAHLFQANEEVTVGGDGSYPKRGFHSPVGHASLICNKTVIAAHTVKRSSQPSESAYGDIKDIQANKMEEYAITKMLKHLIPYIGPLIVQIDLDQDATVHKVIENLKWTAEDMELVNKYTGRKEITQDMVGQSVWQGKVPRICFDKVSAFIDRFESIRIRVYQNAAIYCNIA